MDAIDRVVEQWAKEKPELETEPMAMMGRYPILITCRCLSVRVLPAVEISRLPLLMTYC